MAVENLEISHQTLEDFVKNPFGKPNNQKQLKYEDRYLKYKKSNKIKIESSIELEKNYFIHLKVPSESQKGSAFNDVVVQFFTTNDKVSRELTVEHYYVQFFSNSPGFVYKYSALYKMTGYLIEALSDKYTDGMLNVLPSKTNSDYELSYDSSIYYACRYLLDNKLTTLGKLSLKIFKTKSPSSFFADVVSVDDSNINRDIIKLEKSVKNEIIKDNALSKAQADKLKKKNTLLKPTSTTHRIGKKPKIGKKSKITAKPKIQAKKAKRKTSGK